MKLVFSTTDVPGRDRFDYWHSVACQNVTNHDSSPSCRPRFHAELRAGELADFKLVEFSNAAMTVAHNAGHAAQADPEEVLICRQGAGRLIVEQEGRQVLLEPGDITLLDPRSPYVAEFSPNSHLLVVKAPRRELEGRIGSMRSIVAYNLRSTEPTVGLTGEFLAAVPNYVGRLDSLAEGLVRNQALDLVALSIGTAMGDLPPNASTARLLARMRVRAAIEAGLQNPRLNASAIASTAGVRVRYANSVLADEHTSISRLIQERRLERCRKALEDPAQAHRSVSEIAYAWGFSDMTHFGRKFRHAFGPLPSEYRRARAARTP